MDPIQSAMPQFDIREDITLRLEIGLEIEKFEKNKGSGFLLSP
jgi:hypothetical protein